ncbi:unnamed protein product [Debaryomyces tyrocola]|nr:unnamed protein product [Debaryomyces tyrocola]
MASLTATVSLHNLVKLCCKRNSTSKVFVSLYNQLEEKLPIKDNDYLSNLLQPDIKNKSKRERDLRTEYVLALSISSESQLEKFWKFLPEIVLENQIRYLIELNNILLSKSNIERPSGDIYKEIVNNCFFKYTSSYVSSLIPVISAAQVSLLNHIIVVWCSVIRRLSFHLNTSAFKQLAVRIVSLLTECDLQNLLNYFISNTSSILNTDDLQVDLIQNSDDKKIAAIRSTTTIQLVNNISSINPKSRKATQLNIIKRYLWLNSIMKNWKFNNGVFLKQFEQNFLPNSLNNLKKPYVLAFELMCALFRGIVTSICSNESKYVLFNWKNFIITRLPTLLNGIKFTTQHVAPTSHDSSPKQESLDDAIINAFESFEDPVNKVLTQFSIDNLSICDLRQTFIKSCIYNKHQFLNNGINQVGQITSIRDEFEKKLLNINTEFTTLEDSGLIEYINSLPSLVEFLATKQLELSETVDRVIEHLIDEKNIEKLYRLLLSVCNNLTTLNLICFNSNCGPFSILYKLINYIDNEDFNVDDDDNFQETYAFFGIIILSILLIIETFKIDYSQISINNSYIIDYINEFYYRLCDNLTNISTSNSEEDNTIISNYNDLISDWINALFDDNNDGLSDDLIKSVNVKQIYKMIPIIYQQSIIATNSNKIDIKILNNGIDYLSQMFLIPCTLNIIKWLLRKIWADDPTLDCLPVQVLHELIKSNMGENDEPTSESKLFFQIVLKISGNSIISTLKKLKNWENSNLIKGIIEKVSNSVDPMYLENGLSLELNERVSLCEQLKTNVITLVNNGNIYDYQFLNIFSSVDKDNELMRYIVEEITSYQKTSGGNEDTKLFINLSIFMILLNAIDTDDDKQYWIKRIKDSMVPVNCNSSGENRFDILMDYHYSSIFNNSDETSNNDYLFSGENNNSSVEIEGLKRKIGRHESLLNSFNKNKELCDTEVQSTFVKSLRTFRDKLINELEVFTLNV